MLFTPSERQKAIFERIEAWDRSPSSTRLIVNSVAGSGKTTSILRGLERMAPSRTKLFLAFNVSAAKEAQAKAAEIGLQNLTVKTLNSAGYAVLREHGKTFVDDSKYSTLLRELADADMKKGTLRPYDGPAVLEMVSLARAHGIIVKGVGRRPDTQAEWFSIASRFRVERFGHAELMMARRLLAYGLRSRVIDMDDQCYMPFAKGLRSSAPYDAVVVDEAQDLTLVQQALAGMFAHDASFMMFVGDRAQAIYGFRGADTNSMDTIIEQYGCDELQLDVSYRCPRAVVAEAQRFNPVILPHESSEEGLVDELWTYTGDHIRDEDLVVCRNRAPLVRLALKLIADHRTVCVGNDTLTRVASAIKMVAKAAGNRRMSIADAIVAWERSIAERMAKDENDGGHDMDILECCRSLMEICGTVDDALRQVSDMQRAAKAGAGIRLMTIHRAKGLEAEIVWFLEPALLPSTWVTTPDQIQENNLAYVAITRARRGLHKITVDGYAGSRIRTRGSYEG